VLLKPTTDLQIFERDAIHNGNLVLASFMNFGVLGHVEREVYPKMEWPKGSGMSYGWQFVTLVAAEITDTSGTVVHIMSDRYAGHSDDRSHDYTHYYGWVPLPGYFNDGGLSTIGIPEDMNENGKLDLGEDMNGNGTLDESMDNIRNQVATSDYPSSWPILWPNRDDFWIGKWNGEYGAYSRADQESYYLMDDRYNDEYGYYPYIGSSTDSSGFPDGRRGLGIEIEVRGYQWSHVMAEDILIVVSDIRNVSHKPLKKVVFGMYVDSDVGQHDANDDLASFNELDDITYQWDLDGLDREGNKTGYFGFAFLESPGEPTDGVDNDEDGMVDESQSDLIDNDGDWTTFTDVNHNGVWDSEDQNSNGELDAGEDTNGNGVLDIEPLNDDLGTDGVGPDFTEYKGPDLDASQGNGQHDPGEPNFEFTDNDESDQIGLTSWIWAGTGHLRDDELFWNRITPGTFSDPTTIVDDITYTYGSGYIKLPISQRVTEQVGEVTRWFFARPENDKFRRFSIACLFGNDFNDILRNKRTMQTIYDNDYNFTKPPLKPKLVARSGDQKVYLYWDTRSERSNDPVYGRDFEGYKLYRATDPQFNEIKTITDAFGNPLMWKPIAQWDVKDSLTETHPIEIGDFGALYYLGDDSGLKHYYVDENVENGRTYYYALVAYDMGYENSFYERGLSVKSPESVFEISPTENTKTITTDAFGDVLFLDVNTAMVVPNAPTAGYIEAQAEGGVKHISGSGTGEVNVEITEPKILKDGHTYRITFSDSGTFFITDSIRFEDITENQILFESGDMYNQTSGDSVLDKLESLIFDGLKLDINNDYDIEVLDGYWDVGGKTNFGINIKGPPAEDIDPKTERFPFSFEFQFTGANSDTAWSAKKQYRIPVNFQIWDITNNRPMDFMFDYEKMLADSVLVDSVFSPGDIMVLILNPGKRRYEYESWEISINVPADLDSSQWIWPEIGDVYRILISRPFRHDDVFEFTMRQPKMDESLAKNKMDQIYVVPDPYVVTAQWERPHLYGAGRGERRVDFVNLPQKCTIKIFTPNGKLVRTIEHDGLGENGSEKWDLLSKDGLTVSYGIYLYHVDAPKIGTKIGRFAIIK